MKPPRVIQVIESTTARGKGTMEDPNRTVTQYHTLDGQFLAEHDSWTDAATYEDVSVDDKAFNATRQDLRDKCWMKSS